MTSQQGVLVRPARIDIDPVVVQDLHRRLAATRTIGYVQPDPWTLGPGVDAVVDLINRWRDFDIHAWSQRLNDFEQLDVVFEDSTVRVVHFRAEDENALPIVITHGWPSSVLEILPLAQRLADPHRYGGDPTDAFHVVVPALPGFPLSSPAGDLGGYTGAGMADRWADVMSALGYERFAASGGDIGARVAAWLGMRHPDRVIGIHVTSNALQQELPDTTLTTVERTYVEQLAQWEHIEGAYMHIQETKPLSLAHGLADSPAGLAAWILEKWHAWSGHTKNSLDDLAPELLGHLTLYWLTNSIATSLLPYHAAHLPPGKRPWGRDIQVPVSFYLAPDDIGGIPPREFVERQYHITHWTALTRGGHFLASEESDLLATDIRDAFRRAGRH